MRKTTRQPNEGLPNEGLPNEGLPNEGLPNEGLPNEGLIDALLACPHRFEIPMPKRETPKPIKL